LILTFSKSVRALAKTQVTLARQVGTLATVALIYTSSNTFLHDASTLAAKLGKGDEALRTFAQSKFGNIFTKK
jgi:hypothetical protein